jgi:dienelactone hydrolase
MHLPHRLVWFGLLWFVSISVVSGQTIKPLPPPGIELPGEVRARLAARVAELEQQIGELAMPLDEAQRWRPQVEALVRAVRLAVEQNLFYKEAQITAAAGLLEEAERRLHALQSGTRGLALLGLRDGPRNQPQLLVGGFRSRIDDSVQPFGLVVPANYRDDGSAWRVDVWLHGRGDTQTEIPFLVERMNSVGQYAPPNTFVLHPFGRHCNAFKFAGETDVYEALDHLGTLIRMDADRVAIRGFSMGGAGCWHLAVHDPGRWFAVNPGAGFVDTVEYQGWTNQSPLEIDATRRQLLNWYDVLPWVTNLRNTRTIAYSGELDKQRLAADRVAQLARDTNVDLQHVIGAGMGHKIDADSAAQIDAVLAGWDEQVREQQAASGPRPRIDFVTYTLRYHQLDWLSVTGLRQHWRAGRLSAEIRGDHALEIVTDGVTGLKLDFSRSGWPYQPGIVKLTIDRQQLELEDWGEAPGNQCELQWNDGWSVVDTIDPSPRKRPGMQGPIDDAFCDRFLFVAPSRPATHGEVERWIDREFKYAMERWSRLMRGEVRVVVDRELTEEQIQSCHLICFGDFNSNQYLRGIAAELPIDWTRDKLVVGKLQLDPSVHAAAFCYPNPRNPDRYVVVNSGMTFRDFSNSSNSRQIAMLPDWAILDVSGENADIYAGKIVADGFFDERWSLQP